MSNDSITRSDLMKNALLNKFYKNPKNVNKVTDIVNRNTVYSRRILEWFCSNYAKRYNINYTLSNGENFNVFQSYKCQLNSYQKKQFDPFKRSHKGYGEFKFFYDKTKYFMTTVGQLNFFKWCIENKILEYIENNIAVIKTEMKTQANDTDKKVKIKKKETGISTKHKKISKNISRVTVKTCDKITLSFS
jgi:hypothetical protein